MARAAYNLAGVSVFLAMPVNRDPPMETVLSLLETASLFTAKNVPLNQHFNIGSSIITAARSRCVHDFLKSDATHLFWVDSDIGWHAKDFLKLVCLCTKLDCVGATYPKKRDPLDFILMIQPGLEVEMNDHGCIPVDGMGLGFACIKREIIEKLVAKAPKLLFPDCDDPIAHVFREGVVNGLFQGEDSCFFEDIRALGHTVWMDPSVHLKHVGSKAYAGAFIDIMERHAIPKAA